MEYREFGATGVKVPEIGFGTWQYRGGSAPLRKAVELGACLIDTAEMYGTEADVGAAIKGMREKVFVATKVSSNHLRHNEVLAAADASLKRLGIDTIDLYQIHWPDPAVPIAETMGAMEKLVDTGKARFIGVSNFYLKNLQEAEASMTRHKIVSNQVKYSLLQRGVEEDTLAYCQNRRIAVVAYSPLARGDLCAKPLLRNRHALGALEKIAAETGKTMAQVALNWVLHAPGVTAPILGARTAGQLQGALRSDDLTLPAEIAAALDDVSAIDFGYPERDD